MNVNVGDSGNIGELLIVVMVEVNGCEGSSVDKGGGESGQWLWPWH